MMYFVSDFTPYQERNKSAKEFLKRLPDYKNTLLPDEKSVQQLLDTVRGEIEDVNLNHKSCKPMECVVTELLGGTLYVSVETPSASLNPKVLSFHIVKVAHTWNNEKGGIR